jgi:hypothetical protein
MNTSRTILVDNNLKKNPIKFMHLVNSELSALFLFYLLSSFSDCMKNSTVIITSIQLILLVIEN